MRRFLRNVIVESRIKSGREPAPFNEEAVMPTKFVLRKRGAKYSFEMIAGNGTAIAKSIGYASKRTAMNAIRSIQTAGKSIEDVTEKPMGARRPASKKKPAKRRTTRVTAAARKPSARRATAQATIKRVPRKPLVKKSATKKTAPKRAVQTRVKPTAGRPRTAARPVRPKRAARAKSTRTKVMASAR